MAPPQQLAFPPTALRNVAAGLVVGNPVGSGGTRAKALTAAELKAIVEASGISYLPLSGGTLTGALSLGSNGLTCGAITASGNIIQRFSGMMYANLTLDQSGTSSTAVLTLNGGIAGSPQIKFSPKTSTDANLIEGTGAATMQLKGQTLARITGGSTDLYVWAGKFQMTGDGELRNGITPTRLNIHSTYTSTTAFANLDIRANAVGTAYEISSFKGSAGGSNLPINIGHRDSAGTFTSALSVATDGGVSGTKIGAGGAAYGSYPLTVNGSAIFRDSTGTSFVCFHGKSGTWMGNADDNYAFASYKPSIYFFTNGEYASTASAAIALHSGSVSLGKALVPKTLADSAAPNGSIYYSSDASKLVFKDSGGTVHDLY